MQPALGRVDPFDVTSIQAPILENSQAAPRRRPNAWREFRLTRPRRVLWLLAAVWVLNGFDLGFTMVAHAYGHFTELNPIAADLLSQPWYYVTAFKFISLSAGSVILLMLSRHQVAELGSWLLLTAYVFVALRWYDYFGGMLDDPLLVLLR